MLKLKIVCLRYFARNEFKRYVDSSPQAILAESPMSGGPTSDIDNGKISIKLHHWEIIGLIILEY